MYKKSNNRLVFLIILCAGFWLLNFYGPQQSVAAPPVKPAQGVKNAPSTAASSSAGQPASNKPQSDILPLAIQDLFLKSNHVWIAIARTGKGDLGAASYSRIMVKVAGSKFTGRGQWTLAQVDPGHALLQPTEKIEFDTKLILKKADRLTASIAFGTWKHTKQETLKPSYAPSGSNIARKESSQGTAAPGPGDKPARASGAARPVAAPPTPVLKGGPSSGGLTFAVPGAGQTVTAGEALYFVLRFDRSIAEGQVTITLMRDTGPLTSKTYSYRPIEGEWSLASHFNIPTRGIFASDHYFLYAVHTAGNRGNSPPFSIRLPGREGLIRIINPKTGDVYNPKQSMRVGYQMTRAAAGGLVRFEMFAYPFNADPPVLSWTSNYAAQPAGAPQPVFFKDIRLPADPPFTNEYFIQASHAEGSGRSGTFSIAPLITEGGAGLVEDIAVIDIAKDPTDGAVKVLARVTGAPYPLRVDCSPHPPDASFVVLRPGDNVFTLDTAPFNGRDGTCSRNYSVRLDPENHYTETNEANNNLEKEVFFLDRNGKLSVFDHSPGSTIHIPSGSRGRVFDFVFHYCGIDRNNMWFLVREIRQKGVKHWSIGDVPFDQIIAYEKWVTDDCDHLGRERRESTFVEPGQCVFLRINREALEEAESDVTIYLNEPYASWPGVRQPLTVHIDWTH